jgi:membrane associated rhomboid family serine protease
MAGSMSGGPPDDEGILDPELVARLSRERHVQAGVWRRLVRGMQRPWMTWALVSVMGLLHLIAGVQQFRMGAGNLAGILVGQRPRQVLIDMGAMFAPGIEAGEIWRLISCIFLHGDGTHILLNGVALIGLGRLWEGVVGPLRLLWLVLLTGLGGAVLSFVGGNEASVGASGAIFGLMGACMVFGWRFRRELPLHIGELFRRKLLPWVGLNLFIGYVIPFIDNLGHVGGLITGAALAMVCGNQIIPGHGGSPTGKILMGVGSGALLLGALLGVVIFQ